MFHKKLLLTFIFIGGLFNFAQEGIAQQSSNEISVQKIWDNAPHNAFTDLIFFKGKFYCSFREGDGHVPKKGVNGTVRILSSKDGRDWHSVASLEKSGIDLRDPKISVTPSGVIMVIMGGSIYENGVLKGRIPQVSFSDKHGASFSAPEKISIAEDIVSWGDWIWRVTWHKGTGYAMDYQIGPEERRGPTAFYLLKTTDGKHFSSVLPFQIDGFPNEATIRFDPHQNMHILIRRELEDQMGMFATATSPFNQWDIYKTNYRLGGPNFVFTKKGKKIIGTRIHEPSVHMGLLAEDSKGVLREIMQLPSSGDCSYPGLLVKGKWLYVSYYSSHEGKSAIYFCKIPLTNFK